MELKGTSVNDILDNIGVSLTGNDLELILNHNQEAMDRIKQLFEDGLNAEGVGLQVLQYLFNASVIRQVFGEFEESVNKECLITLTLYNHKNALENGSEKASDEQKKQFRRYIANGIRLLGRTDIDVVDLEYDRKSDKIARVKVINSQELIKCIKRGDRLETLRKTPRKKAERIAKIDEEIDFENIVQTLLLSDIQYLIGADGEIGYNIVSQISSNALREFAKTHSEVDKEMLNGDKPLGEDLERQVKESEVFRKALLDGIKANLKYIDLDRLLLVSAFRYIDMVENDDKGEIRVNSIEDDREATRESSLEIVHEITNLISQNVSDKTVIEEITGANGEKRKYSVNDLEADLSKFVEGDYIRNTTIQKAKADILSGEKTLYEVNREVVKRMEFSNSELVYIMKLSEQNAIFLIENNIIEKKEIYTILHLLEKCSLELFKVIIDKDMLDGNQILKLYEYGIIGLEHIKIIENEELLNSINVEERISQICISMQNSKENENLGNIEHLNKIAALYKLLRLEGKSEEEIKENANTLIGKFEENISNEILERLYQFGIISLDIAADWGMDLIEMMSKGEMKPTDLRRLYNNSTIRIDQIRTVVLNSELSYEEKLDLIYSTFDGESEEEYSIREELMQLLESGDSYKAESKATGVRRSIGVGPKTKEYVTDPHTRWKLISLLDKEYSRKFLPKGKEVIDGHRVFLLPSLDSVVIERMYEKRTGKRVNAYGSATYIMESEEFFRNIDDIIINGAINRTELRELSETEKATKIIHSSVWGESIKRYFGVNEENERYSEEDIKEIDNAIANVNSSRKERESK